MIEKYKYKIKLSYGTGDGNMLDRKNLKYFIEKDLEKRKCELITGDGGIEIEGQEYEI